VIDTIIAIPKRHSPPKSTVLFGALRAHRTRNKQDGAQPEITAEAAYDNSLRRTLGDQFDELHAQGLRLNETEMITLAFTQLDKITQT
jgi:hypothetical protein